MLKRFFALFFVASLFTHFHAATAFGQSDPSALDQLRRAAEQSLPSAAESEKPSLTQARRLVRTCFQLAQLSPEDHEQVCGGHTALRASVQVLGANETALTPDERLSLEFYRSASTNDSSLTPPQGKTSPPALAGARVKERRAVAKALAAEITKVSMEYRLGSVRGSLSRRIEAEARLRTLYADLKRALGPKSHLLPSDPHAFVGSKDILASSLNSYKIEQRYFDYFTTLVNNADVQTTRDTLREEVARLEALIKSDQPGQFHRARGEIEAAIDVDEWRDLSQTRDQRAAAERVRVEQEWRAKYPTAIIPQDATLRPPAGQTYWSELALKAIRSYALDSVEWVAAESELLATYSRIQQRGGTTKLYVEWVSSLMTPSDLELAILYTKSIEAHGGYLQGEGAALDPNAAHRRYYAELSKPLQGEWFMRRKGLAQPPPPPQTPPDAGMLKLRELYSVRLLKERYGDVSQMPEEPKGIVRSVHTQFSNEDFAKALKQYESLTELSDQMARSNQPLEARQLDTLTKARAAVLRTFQRADEIFEERIQAGVLEPNPNTRKTKSIIATLKGGRPPNDLGPSTSSRPPSPPSPPDAPTALISEPQTRQALAPRGPKTAPLELTDAHFNAALNNGQASLQELQRSLSNVKTTPETFGASQGRLTVKEDNVWRGNLNYSTQPLSSAETRMPKSLQKWAGLINPATNKPYVFKTDVKVFRSFDAVGGGIHFGDDASLRVPANLSEFVLTFDEQAQTLVLQGPGNNKYLYGPISPRELKALYRFAISEQNSAISVGWAGPQDVPEERDSEGGSPVLLDPAFVDTPVGQTLFEADSIPWELDRDLPGGIPHPFTDDFKKAYGEYTKQSVNLLLPLFDSVVKFEDQPVTFWQSVFNGRNTRDDLVLAVISTADLQQAKVEYLKTTRAAEVAPLLNKPGIAAKQRQEIKKFLESVTWWAERLDTLSAARISRTNMLLGLSKLMISSGDVDKKWVTLWAALTKSHKPTLSSEQLARYFLYELPNTTLAVLIDEPTTILLSGDQLILKGDMRYRYATSEIQVIPDKVLVGRSLPQGVNQVRELRELTQLANSALPKLADLYQPLGRTLRYARIVSFLRWARGRGRLLAIDFSSLAAYPASDRILTPTPDAVIRR